MKIFHISVLSLCFCLCFSLYTNAIARAEAQSGGEGTAAITEINVTELTRNDILTRINAVLDNNLDIRAFVPDLEEKTMENNIVYYEFEGKKIEDLDQDTLLKLFRNVNQQLAWKDFRRLKKQQKQLEELRRLSHLPRTLRRK